MNVITLEVSENTVSLCFFFLITECCQRGERTDDKNICRTLCLPSSNELETSWLITGCNVGRKPAGSLIPDQNWHNAMCKVLV